MRGQNTISRLNTPGAEVGAAARRSHGSSAWSLPTGTGTMRQPQDGAQMGVLGAARALLCSMRSTAFPEPEDAKITGGTRSLTRRLLGLNVTAAPRKISVAALAGFPAQRAA